MKIKRMILIALAAVAGSAAADAAQPPQKQAPLNVLLIIADDLGIGDVGCYGSKWLETPNIDRLAAEGVRATDAHASAAVCTPSRYAILSGRYFHRYSPCHGLGEALIEADRPTIASVFRDNGYTTGYFGKTHTGWGEPREDRKHTNDIDWNSELPRGVLEMGFDKFFGTPRSHNEPPYIFVEDRHVIGLDPADPLKIVLQKEAKAQGLVNWGWGASIGAKKAHEARPVKEIDRIVTDKVIEFIGKVAGTPSTTSTTSTSSEQASSGQAGSGQRKPFFINLAYVAPHVPTYPSEQFRGTSKLGWYGDCVEQMDWYIGRVLQALETHGLMDNTLIIFTSDNGAIFHKEYLEQGQDSNLGLLGQKTDVWEGGMRVPLIVRWPGHIPAGSTVEPLISLVDLSKTAWAAAGITPPEGASPDALNQLDLITGKSTDAIRTELYMTGIAGAALRSGDWVYIPQQGSAGISTLKSATWALQINELGQTNSDYDADGTIKPDAPDAQLYNLRTDPRQSTNVIREHPEKAAELAERFKEVRN